MAKRAKFNKEGRQLRSTGRVPKELLGGVMVLMGGNWTTKEIRRACDVIDGWNEQKGKWVKDEEAGKGWLWKPSTKGRDPDYNAVNLMFSLSKLTGETAAETLARKVLAQGIGKSAATDVANVKRLAKKFKDPRRYFGL